MAAYIDERFGSVVMYLRLIGISAGSETPILRVLKAGGAGRVEEGDLGVREEGVEGEEDGDGRGDRNEGEEGWKRKGGGGDG